MSDSLAIVNGFLAELGARIGFPGLELGASRTIALSHPDLGDVSIELAPGEGRTIHFAAAIGRSPNGDREAFYAALLRYNRFDPDLGGAALALSDDDDRVLVCYSVPVSLLDRNAFECALSNFVELALGWRKAIGRLADAVPTIDGGMANALRG